MRRHKAPVIEIDDLDAFDFATALVNPLVGDQDALKALSQGNLSHHDRGQLFEMVVALASALMRNAGAAGKIRRDNSSRSGIVGLSPDALTRAARALLSWPQGFVDLCRVEADGLHQRSVYYGKFKELGAVALLRRDVGLDADSRTTIEDGIKRYLTDTAAPRGFPRKSEIRLNNEYAGLTELRKRHGVRASAISRLAGIISLTSVRSTDAERSPVLLPRRMADGILTRYKYLLSEESVCYQLGIPPDAVRDLAESSLLRLSTGIEDKLCASPVNYDGMVFEYLFGFFRDTHPVASKMPDYVPLREAMLMFPSGRYPWAPLIWDIMRGDLPSVFNREPPKKGWLGAISVKASCIDESDVIARQRRLPDHDIGRVPISSANLMLGIRNYAVFEACVAAGLLFLDAKKTLAYQDVLAFASKHILTVEIAARSQRHGIGVRPWLESHGIVPVLEIPQRGGVYERPIVERRLKALGSEKRTRRPSSKNDGADNLA